MMQPLLASSLEKEDHHESDEKDKACFDTKAVINFKLTYWLITLSCVVIYGCVLPFNNIAQGILLERDFSKLQPTSCELMNPIQCQSETNGLNFETGCHAGSNYLPPLPLNYTMTSDIDCGKDEYKKGCTKDYCAQKNKAVNKATNVMSVPYFISAIMSPLLGGFVDRFGHRALLMTGASVVLVFVHISMAVTTLNPIVPMIGQGVAYSCFAAIMWPSISLVVPEENVGVALGLTTAVQNGGLALFPLFLAAVKKSNANGLYIPNTEYFFTSLAVFGVFIGLALNYADSLDGHKLNKIQKAN
jgi:hypothetical protein